MCFKASTLRELYKTVNARDLIDFVNVMGLYHKLQVVYLEHLSIYSLHVLSLFSRFNAAWKA